VKDNSDIKNWHDLKKFALPTNSLILTDNYILKQKSDIENNLIPILDSFLPNKLAKANFQVIIVTQEMIDNDLSIRFNEIQRCIKKMSKPYEIILSLITAAIDRTHPRRIFTNYCMYESENSFTYFDERINIKKNTVLRAFPSSMVKYDHNLSSKDSLWFLKLVKEIIENNYRQRLPVDLVANNRLLSLI
jgi:hypothetical protein